MTSITGQPLVSVVMPVYNGEKYLREALDSVLAQTYSSVEIILMDDASTDGTAAIARDYGSRIRYHHQATNRGIYDNVNDGIRLAKGELIATYHADDVYDPRIIERQVDCFRRYPGLGAVFCVDILADAEGREYGRLQLPTSLQGSKPLDARTVFNGLLTYHNIFLVCPTAMVPAAVHQALGVYRQDVWRNTADLDMWLRIIEAYPILVLEEYLMRYRHFPQQSSRRYHHLRKEPGRFFPIMDAYLSGPIGAVAEPAALRAYEAYRCEDLLMVAVNGYITRDDAVMRSSLARVRMRTLLGSRHIKRARMVMLHALLRCARLLPYSSLLAAVFYWRWQSGRKQGASRGELSGLGRALAAWWRNELWTSERSVIR